MTIHFYSCIKMTVLLHTVYRKNIRPFYIVPFALSATKWVNYIYRKLSLFTQLCSVYGRHGETVCKCTKVKITWGKNSPVYNINLAVHGCSNWISFPYIEYTVLKPTASKIYCMYCELNLLTVSFLFIFYFFIKICIKHINSETKKLLHDSSQGIEKNMLKTSDGLHWIKMLAGTEILEATVSWLTLVCAQPAENRTKQHRLPATSYRWKRHKR